MSKFLQVMKFRRRACRRQNLFLAHRLDDRLLAVLLRLVGFNVCGTRSASSRDTPCQLVRQDRRSLGDRRPQAARVVDMAVRVDDVRHRLVGDQPPGLGDDGLSARFALPPLDDRDVLLESTAIAA